MRRSGGIVGGLILACCVPAIVWFLLVPQYRPRLGNGQVYGIDVSHHQGSIDWHAVAADGVEFAYIKATEGGDWVDPRFLENWTGAAAAGLERGAYHFFRTCTDGRLQAENILRSIPADGELPIVIDVEPDGVCGDHQASSEFRDDLIELVATVELERGAVIFYVLDGFDDLDDIFARGGRWRRSILRAPAPDDWAIWQFSFNARVDGVAGGVDLNIGRPVMLRRDVEEQIGGDATR